MTQVEFVRDYYFSNWDRLSTERQIEFAWALYAHNGDKDAYNRLTQLRSQLTGDGDFRVVLDRLVAESAQNFHSRGKSAVIQQRLFARHPGLLAQTWALLYCLRIRTIFGLDVRKEILDYFGMSEFERVYDNLWRDPEAVALLVAGVNYLYLSNELIFNRHISDMASKIVQLVMPVYDVADRMHLKAFSYMYSHLVINEAQFFTRPIDPLILPDYIVIINDADEMVERYFDDLSLDNKLEHLLSMQLVGLTSRVESRIEKEASLSWATGRPLLVDRLNRNPNKHPLSVTNMTHTMALYIMVFSGKTLEN